MGNAIQQGLGWGARARDWADANEPAWSEVFAAVLDRTGATAGTVMLDVGCGAGGALALARQRGATVSGLDASENLTTIARERLPGADIRTGDMEDLPFDDGAFGLVTGINSFQFAETPARALAEAARVCRKGGVIGMMTWGPPEECQLLSMVMPAIFPLSPPSAPGAKPMLSLARDGTAQALFGQAGLDLETCSAFAAPLEFPDLGTAVRAILSASSRAIAHSGDAEVRDAATATLRPLVREDGRVRLDNTFVLAAARR